MSFIDEYLVIFAILIAIPFLVFSPFYFAKKFGSKLAFLSMGYGVLVLVLCGTAIVFWSTFPGEGLAVWFLYPVIVILLPGQIMLSALIYFFWPARFEPIFDDLFRQAGKVISTVYKAVVVIGVKTGAALPKVQA